MPFFIKISDNLVDYNRRKLGLVGIVRFRSLWKNQNGKSSWPIQQNGSTKLRGSIGVEPFCQIGRSGFQEFFKESLPYRLLSRMPHYANEHCISRIRFPLRQKIGISWKPVYAILNQCRLLLLQNANSPRVLHIPQRCSPDGDIDNNQYGRNRQRVGSIDNTEWSNFQIRKRYDNRGYDEHGKTMSESTASIFLPLIRFPVFRFT